MTSDEDGRQAPAMEPGSLYSVPLMQSSGSVETATIVVSGIEDSHGDGQNGYDGVLRSPRSPCRGAATNGLQPAPENGKVGKNNNGDEGDDDDVSEESEYEDMSSDEEDEPTYGMPLEFTVNRASVSRSGLIPCCLFVARVTWGATDWEIQFGQKQLLRLHISLMAYELCFQRQWLRDVKLPWTLWREKRAEKRVADVDIVQQYIRQLLDHPRLRYAEPLMSFLEVSPSRCKTRYGPSLKEGYVHMRMNGPFQLPLYKCFNPGIEALYRHLYRTWMRVAFVSAVVTFIFPLLLIIITNLPRFFLPQKPVSSEDKRSVSIQVDSDGVVIGLLSLAFAVFLIVFVYKFFSHRLGVVRRWVVLKPNCFAAYRKRSDREPSEVFLFDRTFTARKGSYRQGVSWMPNGFVVGSNAGFIEVDTGHYYTRFTMFLSLAVVCYGIMYMSNQLYDFHRVPMPQGVTPASVPSYLKNMTRQEKEFCGYFFTVPKDQNIHVRAYNRPDVRIYELQSQYNNSFSNNLAYIWQGNQVSTYMGLISSSISGGSVVGVSKTFDAQRDLLSRSGISVPVTDVGNLELYGSYGTDLSKVVSASYFCHIPIEIAVFKWSSLGYYILLLLTAGIVAAVTGLTLNYLITYLGLWHAQVRRDQWFRCLQLLQKAKLQDTEYRFDSFAPERKSHVAPDEQLSLATARSSDAGDAPSSKTSSDASSLGLSTGPAPPNSVSWHVDGEDTYEAMYHAIMGAQYEILIAGWWVTPDLYLLRPGRTLKRDQNGEHTMNDSQLRTVLLKKAQEGVKVYVLIYREVKIALSLNSHYTKRSLMIHPNIRVLRDPIFQIQSLGFWSHHEKIVCIDQSVAFVGGLDICFGRYDHSGHPLSDCGGEKLEDQTWPGKDYSNPVTKDFVRVHKPFEDLIDRNCQPRMPWHDVHCSISGPAVQDVAYHFIQRWNFVCSKNDYQLRTGWCICLRSRRFKYLPKCIVPMDFSGWRLRYPAYSTRMEPTSSDTMLVVNDEPAVSNTDDPFQVVAYRSFANSIDQPCQPSMSRGARVCRSESMPPIVHRNSRICNIQVVRSVSLWSAGVHTEQSVHEAYIETIRNAQHFIYIENQFFISGMKKNGVVSNRILQALVDRIKRAYNRDETFRVYVIMPLMPAFEGNIRSEELTNLHAVMHWQFNTICRHEHSLFGALRSLEVDPSHYVSFFGLRKYGIMPNGCVSTEQIYIHSKLLIADDRRVIIGSANINDRSMCGDRDSEIALVIDDVQFEHGKMNETSADRGVVAGALRLQLFREHLGLPDHDLSVLDPVCQSTWDRIRGISERNTRVFESVFSCAPSNCMRTFKDFNNIEVTQIYENERLDVTKVTHVWSKVNLKEGDYAAWTDVNGVPIQIDRINFDEYTIDIYRDKRRRNLFFMDSEGWCYARNFSVFQEARTGKKGLRKREVVQHFMTDRLRTHVRRRRWVKKNSPMDPRLRGYTRTSSLVLDADTPEPSPPRLLSRLNPFHRSEHGGSLSGQSYPYNSSQTSGAIPSVHSSTVMLGDQSYPNSPTMSAFRRTMNSPSNDSFFGRDSAATSGYMGSYPTSFPMPLSSELNQGVYSSDRGQGTSHSQRGPPESNDSTSGKEGGGLGGGLRSSMRKFYSMMDRPLAYGRKSRFTDDMSDYQGDHPFLHLDRSSCGGSVRSFRSDSMLPAHGDPSVEECQIGQVHTTATVAKEDESRARNQLSEIRGHLVDFPLHFLEEEILKPSIMPRNIHI